jgi:hypothetical protein
LNPSINTAVEEHFRIPEGFSRFGLTGEIPAQQLYFEIGEGVWGFGRNRASSGPRGHEILNDGPSGSDQNGRQICRLAFDPREIADNLRLERYPVPQGNGGNPSGLVRSAYYTLRPLLPVPVRKYAQRRVLRGRQSISRPSWPLDRSVDRMFEHLLELVLSTQRLESIPFIWFWPKARPCCILMTHDVETDAGLRSCDRLMDLDDSFAVKSSFQIVPGGRYRVDQSTIEIIRSRGFEVNIHDWNHDGRLFHNHRVFQERAVKINEYAARWQARGFRSAVLYRKPEWFSALHFSYDMSIPSVGHLDPQPGGCCTVLPWFIGDMLEIPVTMVQDYSLFHILNDYSINLWKRQLAGIMDGNGLASFIVHPDYIDTPRANKVYTHLLEHLRQVSSDSGAWVALPHEVDRWWRKRSGMRLVQHGKGWKIEGEGSDEACVAYAQMESGRLEYSFTPPRGDELETKMNMRSDKTGGEFLA